MNKHLSIHDRINNLNKFRELWVEFGNFVGMIAESKIPTPADEATYQDFIARIARMFPKAQADVQRHGLRVNKLVPAGSGYFSNVMNYMPFLNIASICPSLSQIFRSTGYGKREFIDDWSLGDRILLHAIGTLEFAEELGSEENLPTQDDSPTILAEILSAIRRALRPAFKKPPEAELEVQDQVEVILRVQGGLNLNGRHK